ncbi:MAG: ParB N-terminal domain-containing protein [Syntrophobacteraceae bacterium]
MGQNIREIKISKISPNLRAIYPVECIDETARSIKNNGQLEPILVFFNYDSFRIMDGEKRFRACKKIGMSTIKAVIT